MKTYQTVISYYMFATKAAIGNYIIPFTRYLKNGIFFLLTAEGLGSSVIIRVFGAARRSSKTDSPRFPDYGCHVKVSKSKF